MTAAALCRRARANGWVARGCHAVQLGPRGKERVLGDEERLDGIRNPVEIEETDGNGDGGVWGIVSGPGNAEAVVRFGEMERFGELRERLAIGTAGVGFMVGDKEIGDADIVVEMLTEPGGRLELSLRD
jgi:hypothetical protein